MNTESLVVRGAELKLQIGELTDQLRAINLEVAKMAEFKKGSKTGYIVASGIKATIHQKETVKWLQDRLIQVKDLLPKEFNESFIYKYEPASSKVLATCMKENDEFAKAVSWAREIKDATPYVTYEKIEDEEV